MCIAQGMVTYLTVNQHAGDLMAQIVAIWPGATSQDVTTILHFIVATCRKLVMRKEAPSEHRRGVEKHRR
jgi:hypothetical protein